jgi:hypothetical protein
MSNWSLFPENQENCCSNFYAIPMTAPASIQANFEMQNRNKKNILSNFNSIKKNFGNAFENTEFVSSVKYGGMSLWFLIVAVLICVLLFSHH